MELELEQSPARSYVSWSRASTPSLCRCTCRRIEFHTCCATSACRPTFLEQTNPRTRELPRRASFRAHQARSAINRRRRSLCGRGATGTTPRRPSRGGSPCGEGPAQGTLEYRILAANRPAYSLQSTTALVARASCGGRSTCQCLYVRAGRRIDAGNVASGPCHSARPRAGVDLRRAAPGGVGPCFARTSPPGGQNRYRNL